MAAGKQDVAQKKPVLLFDVMDTIVYDPFFKEMPAFFGMTFKELLAAKHPTAWVEFECNRITEEQLLGTFFADGRKVDGKALRAMMTSTYRYLDGMEELLARLHSEGYEMHALSNYPVWWQIIEDKLKLSKYLRWTFVSCTGPMEGVRKPSPEAYTRVIDHLGLTPSQLLFIDDREVNTAAAEAAGVPSIRFTGAKELQAALAAKAGVVLQV